MVFGLLNGSLVLYSILSDDVPPAELDSDQGLAEAESTSLHPEEMLAFERITRTRIVTLDKSPVSKLRWPHV